MSESKTLRIDEVNGYGDYVEARIFGHSVIIETWCEWDGDTETGFGRGAAVTLTLDQAKELATFLAATQSPQQEPK